jgi:undecaprenyl diphosphate synthase
MAAEQPHPALRELGVVPEALPQHIAIIMDGNGRWAAQRNQPRSYGHQVGVESVRAAVERCGQLGIRYLTVYSFSSENWKRPQNEVNALMTLYAHHLVQERAELIEKGVRLRQIGRREGLPPDVLAKMDETITLTAGNTRVNLTLALNYGGRAELVDACRALARRVAAGELPPDEIDEAAIAGSLYTADLPDPDLMIRTAGEMRISNYLLWQLSYAEIYVSPILWPDFRANELDAALQWFARRERRFGAVPPGAPATQR